MRLEDIPKEDIINLNLPRAVPLAYRLDENLKPLGRLDGKLDEATGMLRGEWLGGDGAVAEILERDHKQVYDTRITKNLETDRAGKHSEFYSLHDIMTDHTSSSMSKQEADAHLHDQRQQQQAQILASSSVNGSKAQQLNGVNGVY